MPVHVAGHFNIQRRNHLVRQLDDAYVQPGFLQVFGHFNADEAPADHSGAAGLIFLNERLDIIDVSHVAHCKFAPGIDPLDGRYNRRAAGRKHQLVIAFRVDQSSCKTAHTCGCKIYG